MIAALSIIIPVFNAGKFLDMLLESIEKQTYRDFECIIVNDGSTDNSKEICRKFADRDERFIIINQNNAGVSAARNTGLDKAKGKYIAFADSDDVLEVDMYATLIKALIDLDADVASCNFIHEEKISQLTANTNSVFKIYQQPIDSFYNDDISLDALWNKVYRAKIIGQIRFAPDISYTEDQLFVAEVLLRAKTLALTKAVKYHYMKHGESLSRRLGSYDFWLGHVRAMHQVYEMVESSSALTTTKIMAYEKYGRSIFSLVRFSIQEKNISMYNKIKQEYKNDVEKFFALPGFPVRKQMTYRSYWWGYFLASLIHNHKEK